MSAKHSVLVLEKGVRILDCFTPERSRLSMTELRGLTGIPASTLARLVRALVSMDLLQKSGDDYRIGLRILSWTAAATAGSDLLDAANPVSAELRDITGETAGLYISRGTKRVAAVVKLSTKSIIGRWHVGQVLPMHSGAAGKVFMAHDDRLLNAVLVESSEGSGIDASAQLEAQLKLTREQGWILTEQEREAGLSSLAAPVFDSTGTVVASLGIGGPAFRVNKESARNFGPLIADTASSLSRQLGHVGAGKREL